MNTLLDRWPGEVVSYDGPTRLCRVRIEGVTDGSAELPQATIQYPIGDRPEETEIDIRPGDLVWLAFEAGDARFPIITGYRTPREGNSIDWRRLFHANIELTATGVLRLNATNIQLNSATLTHNGVNIGGTHTHQEQGDGNDVGPPH